jgi:hypothetical protein
MRVRIIGKDAMATESTIIHSHGAVRGAAQSPIQPTA